LDTAGKFLYDDERDFSIDSPPFSDVSSALLGAAIVVFALVVKTKDPLLSGHCFGRPLSESLSFAWNVWRSERFIDEKKQWMGE